MNLVSLAVAVLTASVMVAGCAGSASPDAGTTGSPAAQGAPTPADPPNRAASAAAVPQQLRFTAKTIDGQEFAGHSLVGKPAVVWFWAAWCPKCQREAPAIANAVRAYPNVTFVGVSALDELPAMREFVSKYQVGSIPHIADLDTSVWKRFGVTQQPAFAFLSPDGAVTVHKGTLSEQELTSRINALPGA